MRFLFRRAAADPDRLTVRHEGEDYVVALRRLAAAKRITLRVSSATGQITLTLPQRARLDTARAFLDGHGGWIAARLARVPDRIALAPGETVPLRGLPHRVVRGAVGRSPTRIGADEMGSPVIVVSGDEAGLPGRVRRFLAAQAETDLRAAALRYAALLGVSVSRVSIRDTKSRWGSCSASGALSFSWRLILAPPMVLDYLAAHEVVHRREMNHSARYWAILRELCPHTDEAEAWLKRHGRTLHRYG